jgi:hypothetical protein
MKKTLIKFSLMITIGLLFVGCTDEPENPTFIIERQGEYLTDEYFDVIHVYSFGNNEIVTQEMVKYLIQSEPGGRAYNDGKYRYRIK